VVGLRDPDAPLSSACSMCVGEQTTGRPRGYKQSPSGALTMRTSESPKPAINGHLGVIDAAEVHLPRGNGHVHDIGIAADGSALEPTAPVAPPADVASPADVSTADWQGLLDAVKARLQLTIGARADTAAPPSMQDLPARVRAGVLECVAALDQLQGTLAHELGRRRKLEVEILGARKALAQAEVDLAGTRAGERRARHQSLHDGMTGLPNRSFFRERLDEALSSVEHPPTAVAVLYLDLDGFKLINDAHGHDVGDELLRIIAARLTRALRAGDMVSRLGGDEFACLVTDPLSREQLGHLARALFETVSAPVTIDTLRLAVSPSIGIATWPSEGATAEALLKSADTAMYRAKRFQSGYAFVDRPIDAAVAARRAPNSAPATAGGRGFGST
jgi:diguanylate cyclase (GGDEF)-like protein